MSEDFIPLNQSTPVNNQKRWQGQKFQQCGHPNNWSQNSKHGGFNKRGNNSQHSQRNNSFGSNSSQAKDQGIDAYLHPSMLQDPWSYLRRRYAENQSIQN